MKKAFVLCIGGDRLSLNLRGAMLNDQGWGVTTAAGGHEGINRFSREPADIVVLDLNGNGAQSALIAAEIKRLRPNVPVVMIVDDPKALKEDSTRQADAVILKVHEAAMLQATLRDLLQRS